MKQLITKNLFFAVILVSCLSSVYCDNVHFSDCGSKYDLKYVNIQGCKGHFCPLLMESYVNVTITMTASYHVKKASQYIEIKTKMINFETTSNPGPCNTGRPCPIHPGDATFSTNLWIPDIAPFGSRLTWKMFDENTNMIMCFYTDVHLCYLNDTDPGCYE